MTTTVKVKVLEEAGWEFALMGMSLSYYDHAEDLDTWWQQQLPKAIKRAEKLARMSGNSGESKFLESMQVWIFVQAPRDFWQEMDTYRVGMSKQSASTMHTLAKRVATLGDFSKYTSTDAIANLNDYLTRPKEHWESDSKRITAIKANLPEGWLQERILCTNYKVLQHIYNQRKKHRLEYWPEFLNQLLAQLQHPNYINGTEGESK